jgi:hypothetical protein
MRLYSDLSGLLLVEEAVQGFLIQPQLATLVTMPLSMPPFSMIA